MVGITIQCRLGNQLFQYAFIKDLSERFNTSFYINEKVERFVAPDYFDLEGYNSLKNILNKLLLKIESKNLFKSSQSTDVGSFNESLYDKLPDNTIYNGYFQSELFFKPIASKIQRYISIKKKYKCLFEAKHRSTFTNNRVIAVHIRRGDYLHLNDWWEQNLGSTNLSLPVTYYLNCLKKIDDNKNCKIIFVSDDIAFARSAFSHIPNAEFSDNDMITDFQIIMNADYCILSNSSFAWWAAYLNQKPDKKIFCPQYWLGFKVRKEYPEHIIPENWIQVSIEE